MAIQPINIGIQGNDGNGDTIREAFNKVNDNFRLLNAITTGSLVGLYFTDLDDVPKELNHDYVLVNDTYTNTVTQKLLVGGPSIFLTTSSNTITINNIHETLTRGAYLLGDNYNGTTATVWAVDVGDPTIASPNTIVARDSIGDIYFNVGHGTATALELTDGILATNGSVAATANKIVARDGLGDIYFNIGHGTATSAYYADLAEKYISDASYEAGTVVIFGGEQEITTSCTDMDRRIAGVVSTNPAYLMNSGCNGLPIALQGRVPCKVVGVITKGDMLVSSNIAGVARAEINPLLGSVIGKALENYNSNEVGTIEVVVGRI